MSTDVTEPQSEPQTEPQTEPEVPPDAPDQALGNLTTDDALEATRTSLEFHTRITEARFEEEVAHSEYKAAKAKREAIQEELEAFLRSLNRKARDPQQKLPLVEATDDSGRVERGRAIALSTLNLTPGILESLANAGITTVGEAADYATKHDGFRGIPKIGPQKADQIADVIAEFWTRFEAPATESNPPVEQPTPEQTEVIGVEESGGIE